ncbi:tryptophan synthase subunit beta [bacterium]|nr:tryptophan synthase subunit beta [bacterium]MBU1074174.1 tryptophan synthase subunit beta [bacterium]
MHWTCPAASNPRPDARTPRSCAVLSRRSAVRVPDDGAAGRFGPYGGRYVPETLMPCLIELEAAWEDARRDDGFEREFSALLRDYVGRPSPLYRTRRFGDLHGGGASVYLKREDLNHTGAHKINNSLGQALLARRMGKRRIVAETGAGQHGVATAAACALLGLDCVVYMGEVDMARQAPNVARMKLHGAEVVPVASGTRTLKDATSEAIRDWVTNVADTHYILGSTVGPHPYPGLVRDLQSVIGREARAQFLEATGRLPGAVVACVGGGSNALGIFTAFLADDGVALFGVEAGGSTVGHSASLTAGEPGVLHGALSYLLQDDDGQVSPAHSVAAGLDYPGVGPQHSHLKDTGRAVYETVDDAEALAAFHELSRCEGIIPALESSHALAWVMRRQAGSDPLPGPILINLSGRGDKDLGGIVGGDS